MKDEYRARTCCLKRTRLACNLPENSLTGLLSMLLIRGSKGLWKPGRDVSNGCKVDGMSMFVNRRIEAGSRGGVTDQRQRLGK